MADDDRFNQDLLKPLPLRKATGYRIPAGREAWPRPPDSVASAWNSVPRWLAGNTSVSVSGSPFALRHVWLYDGFFADMQPAAWGNLPQGLIQHVICTTVSARHSLQLGAMATDSAPLNGQWAMLKGFRDQAETARGLYLHWLSRFCADLPTGGAAYYYGHEFLAGLELRVAQILKHGVGTAAQTALDTSDDPLCADLLGILGSCKRLAIALHSTRMPHGFPTPHRHIVEEVKRRLERLIDTVVTLYAVLADKMPSSPDWVTIQKDIRGMHAEPDQTLVLSYKSIDIFLARCLGASECREMSTQQVLTLATIVEAHQRAQPTGLHPHAPLDVLMQATQRYQDRRKLMLMAGRRPHHVRLISVGVGKDRHELTLPTGLNGVDNITSVMKDCIELVKQAFGPLQAYLSAADRSGPGDRIDGKPSLNLMLLLPTVDWFPGEYVDRVRAFAMPEGRDGVRVVNKDDLLKEIRLSILTRNIAGKTFPVLGRIGLKIEPDPCFLQKFTIENQNKFAIFPASSLLLGGSEPADSTSDAVLHKAHDDGSLLLNMVFHLFLRKAPSEQSQTVLDQVAQAFARCFDTAYRLTSPHARRDAAVRLQARAAILHEGFDQVPRSMMLKAHLLEPEEKERIAELLLQAAGQLASQPDQLVDLGKFLGPLGLTKEDWLPRLPEAVRRIAPQPGKRGRKPKQASAETPFAFELDASRIRSVESDTIAVGQMLNRIFDGPSQDDPSTPVSNALQEVPPVAEKPPVSTPLIPGLSPAPDRLLRDLLAHAHLTGDREISETVFREKARALGLMPAACLELINDAAFDALGHAVLEGDGPWEIVRLDKEPD